MGPDVHEVASQVHVVTGSHTNFVLVVDGDEVTVVDSGYPRDRGLLETAIRHIGRSLGDVTAMLLTHAHVDHIGSAEWMRQDLGVPIHCHTDEAAHARGEREERISERDILVRLWRPGVLLFLLNVVARGGLHPPHVAEVTTFSDRQPLDVPGHPVAVHTPGHTRGHVGFHLPERGVLLAGDALVTVDVWDRSDRGPQMIRAPFNHDHAQAVDSLQRLEELQAQVVVPGHGRPYHGTPSEAVREARRHRPSATASSAR